MKKITSLLLGFFIMSSLALWSQQVIKTTVPTRPAGQKDVLELRTAPIPTVRVAFIGLGMRGPGAVERMTHIPGVEIIALCDVVQKNTNKVTASFFRLLLCAHLNALMTAPVKNIKRIMTSEICLYPSVVSSSL